MSWTDLPDLVAKLRVDTSELEGAVSRASRFGSFIGTALGGVAAGVATAAIDKVTAFATGSVDAFSEFEDASAAAGVVFGSAMSKITERASTAASTLGMSQSQIINAANTFGTLGKSANLQGDALADFSNKMTDISGNLASFKGGSAEDAIQAVGAALRGEAEPIRRYGVLLDDATLRQQALAMGLIKTTKEALTPQQRVLAAQAAILKQTTDAQGDFARTSDSTANTQKRLEAETTNAQIALGQKLAPAFTALREIGVSAMKGLVSGMDAMGPVISNATSWVGGLWASFGGVDRIASTALPVLKQVGETLMTFGQQVGDAVLPVLAGLWDVFRNGIIPAATAIGRVLMETVIPALVGIYQNVAAKVAPIIQTLGRVLTENVLPPLRNLAAKIGEAVVAAQPFIQMVASLISWLVNLLLTALGPVVSKLIEWAGPVLGMVFNALGTLIGWIGNALGWIARIAPSIGEAVAGFWSFLGGIVQAGGQAIAWVAALPGRLVSGLASLASLALFKGVEFMRGLGSGIANGVGSVTSAVGSVISGAWNTITGWWDDFRQAGARIIAGLVEGIKSAFGNAREAVLNGLQSLRNLLPFSPAKEGPFSGSGWTFYSGRSMFTALGEGVTAAIPHAVNAATSAAKAVSDAIVISGTIGASAAPFSGSRTTTNANNAGGPGAALAVRVFIGDRELTDMIRVEVGDGIAALTGSLEMQG